MCVQIMLRFTEMITESKAGKNLHLEHIEDEIINFGVDGGRAAINFLRSLRDMLSGSARSSVSMTVKWDGILQSLQVLTLQMVSSLLQRNQYSILIQNYTNRCRDRCRLVWYTKLKV